MDKNVHGQGLHMYSSIRHEIHVIAGGVMKKLKVTCQVVLVQIRPNVANPNPLHASCKFVAEIEGYAEKSIM